MSADELRRAAETLRERAARTTEAPWEVVGGEVISSVSALNVASHCEDAYEMLLADARYIATMHPGVGLALADWIDNCAEWLDEDAGPGGHYGAIAIARLINGSRP